ncbi:tetratricopeptide repeat protein (plasmid) [Burkholderia sp. FERM BP-3421]|jgi:tetratricopeptide (TPR) repeat protein|uniref:tetratricopeptide repeat protein n=1 Tax=Burkholderia sp. FERM BP-3421 TaxID=1494466 RepID=UPI002362020A|nr:tetratricopeptide repeat protein [Burkholderia sp. FERM BP-3421]WDD90704.1 tetratricopeptide repeat protein [Burkholderia sp. FERM BP-3421]
MGATDNRTRSGSDGPHRNRLRQACLSWAIGVMAGLSAPCAMSASGGGVHGAAVHDMQGMSEHMMSALPGSTASIALSDIAANDPEPPTDFQLGSLTKPIKTANPETQAFFDQGLRFYYAFNFREAYRAYRAALKRDPDCVMCRWGIAMSLGVNINQLDQPEQDRRIARQMLEDALRIRDADPKERSLVEALMPRYEAHQQIPDERKRQSRRNKGYAEAMTSLAHSYPDDPDIQTLYADAVMNLSAWSYWDPQGNPAYEDIPPAVDAVEGGLKTHADHMGLVHWYIHIREGSTEPNVVTPFADTLPGLAPGAGHLVHMPSHIYYRTGDHLKSFEANQNATVSDEAYFAKVDAGPGGGIKHPDGDRYRWGYYRHNIHFALASAIMTGNVEDMKWAAARLRNSEGQGVKFRTDRYRGVYYQALTYFMSPDEIIQQPPPDGTEKEWRFARISRSYARVLAYVRKHDVRGARSAYAQLAKDVIAFRNERSDEVMNHQVTQIMQSVAHARIDQMNGDTRSGIRVLEHAVQQQDAMHYDEPPYWMVPVRQTLAALLIDLGRYDHAIDTLHASLGNDDPNRELYMNFKGNGWAYFGLTQAYEGKGIGNLTPDQRKDYDSARKRLAEYCPPATQVCAVSLDRM